MSNTILQHDVVSKEIHRLFSSEATFLNSIPKQYDGSYSMAGASSGDSIRIKRPQRFLARQTMTADVQPITEKYVTISRSNVSGADFEFSSKEKAVDIMDFSKEYLQPAIGTVISDMESRALSDIYYGINNCVTLPVTAIDAADILNAGVILDDHKASRMNGNRKLLLTPQAQADLVNGNATLFNPTANIAKNYTSGQFGNAYGFDVSVNSNLPSHLTGAYDANYICNGAGVEGASTLVVSTGTGAVKKGDIFTIAAVYDIDPMSGASTGKLKKFTVTTDYVGGAGTMAITPALISTGAYKEISALPANTAAITFIGTASTSYKQNLAFDTSAIALGTIDLEVPDCVKGGLSGRSVHNGISVRVIEDFNSTNSVHFIRIDVLWGVKIVVPEWCVRIYQP